MLNALPGAAQDNRTQYPVGLKNAYFGVNIGYINYPFTNEHLEPGYQAESIDIPHTCVRIVLYGLPIGKYISARINYMRPVLWVHYNNVNGDQASHSVWMNVAGITLDGRIPISNKFSLTAESGLGIITRNGFYDETGAPIVADANYATVLLGGSFEYHINNIWDLHINTIWSPENKTVKQPHTFYIGAGFNYHMRPLPDSKVERNANSGFYFPHRFIMAGYTTNAFGYGVNELVSNPYFPIFWGGDVQVKKGFTLSYHQNIFHGRKVFALDWSASMSYWVSRELEDEYFTISPFNPVFKFYFAHSRVFDMFFEYSVAGPTFISKTVLDGTPVGSKFTFYDFIGIGAFSGKNKKIYSGIRIAHHSNGNLYPDNKGIMIPLTFNLGYVLN